MHSALNGKLVTVFGASGFLGRHVVLALARRGYRIRAAVRRPDLAEHLQPLGGVGQIMPVQANLRYRWSVDRAVEGRMRSSIWWGFSISLAVRALMPCRASVRAPLRKQPALRD